MTGLISLFVVVCDFVKSKRSSVAAVSCGGFGEMCQFLKRRKNWLFESWTISSTSPPSRRVGRFSSLKNIIGGGMKNVMWNYRHVAVLGLVALLAGCGGGGGGGSTAAQCTADCTTVNVTQKDGSPVPNVFPTAINPNNGQVCASSSDATSSGGSAELSLSNCGGSTAIVTAPVGGGTVVGTCTVGQTCNLSPGTTTLTAPYAGTWTAKYNSSLTTGDYGTCTVILNTNGVIVDKDGNAVISSSASNCVSQVSASNSFTLWGTLSPDGSFKGSTSAGATYTGAFNIGTTTSAGGSWTNTSAGTSGTWSATRTATP